MSRGKDLFLTVGSEYGPEEFKEKNSRFISYLYPVTSTEEAEEKIARLRKQYRDASHVCFAFRLANGVGEEAYFRFSDDGEPGSTAGLPIYNEIKSKEYLNVLAAVVRYFGGTKLGTGGLVRAYAAAARNVLEVSEPVKILIKKEISFVFPYSLTGEIMQVVNRFALVILTRDYGADGVSMRLAVPAAKMDAVAKSIRNISSGKIQLR
jgi:uncharacterized YigZ family protein